MGWQLAWLALIFAESLVCFVKVYVQEQLVYFLNCSLRDSNGVMA